MMLGEGVGQWLDTIVPMFMLPGVCALDVNAMRRRRETRKDCFIAAPEKSMFLKREAQVCDLAHSDALPTALTTRRFDALNAKIL